jgi:hypothetical protein
VKPVAPNATACSILVAHIKADANHEKVLLDFTSGSERPHISTKISLRLDGGICRALQACCLVKILH